MVVFEEGSACLFCANIQDVQYNLKEAPVLIMIFMSLLVIISLAFLCTFKPSKEKT